MSSSYSIGSQRLDTSPTVFDPSNPPDSIRKTDSACFQRIGLEGEIIPYGARCLRQVTMSCRQDDGFTTGAESIKYNGSCGG
jgi:hypothetical protein